MQPCPNINAQRLYYKMIDFPLGYFNKTGFANRLNYFGLYLPLANNDVDMGAMLKHLDYFGRVMCTLCQAQNLGLKPLVHFL